MHPSFFFVLPKKNAPCTVEEKGALADQLDHLCQVDRGTGVERDGALRTCRLVPGAPDIGGTGIACRRMLRLPACFRGGCRMACRTPSAAASGPLRKPLQR